MSLSRQPDDGRRAMSQMYDDALVTASAYPVSRLPSASDAAADAATRDAVEAGWRALADELARPPEITEADLA